MNATISRIEDAGRKKAHIDSNYFRVSNLLIEHLALAELTPIQYRVIFAIMRKTYGFNVKHDWISATQIATLINYTSDLSNIRKATRLLVARKILVKQDGRKIGINSYVDEWQLSKEGQKQPEKELKTTHKQVKNNPSETSQKQPANELKTTCTQVKNNLLAGQKQHPQYNTDLKDTVLNTNNAIGVDIPESTDIVKMSFTWKPRTSHPDFKAQAKSLRVRNLPTGDDLEYQVEAFAAYWVANPPRKAITQAGWEFKFLQSINRQQLNAMQTKHKQPIAGDVNSKDFTVEENEDGTAVW